MKKHQTRRDFIKQLGAGAVLGVSATQLLSFLGCSASGISRGTALPHGDLFLRGIEPSDEDALVVSPDLNAEILIKWGEVINSHGQTFGYNNDYLNFIPLRPGDTEDLMLWVNHEYPHPVIQVDYRGKEVKTKSQVEVEMDSIGGSILHIVRNKKGLFEVVPHDPLNRRIHGRTVIPFSNGIEVAGASAAMGMVSNCAGGLTPWRTFLSCEENYDLFYGERRHGSKHATFENAKYQWYRYYENAPEHYGWVVEIDPFSGKAQKHVAMGRFAHEGATVRQAANGLVAVYMGDDVAGGCIYKFINDKARSLATGTLYAADTVNGKWIPLDIEKSPKLRERYRTQLEVLIDARNAALFAGATPQDRPEDIEVNPNNGDVVVALTNNAAKNNLFGSLLRISEKNNNPLAREFEAETLISGGIHAGFACPDNLEFDQNGNLWFTTDIGDDELNKGEYAPFKNNGLFVVPIQGTNAGKPLQVISAPIQAELTGLKFTPDYRSIFLSVQHPGGGTKDRAKPTSNWPEGGSSLPRPAVVQVTGDVIARIARRL